MIMKHTKLSLDTNTRRKYCIVCQTTLLDDLVIVGEQYPSAIFPDPNSNYKNVTPKVSLNLTKCSNSACGLVQLSHEYDLDHVFKRYPFVSGATATMKQILEDVVDDMLRTVELKQTDTVLDIGGNDGTLLSTIDNQIAAKINIDAAYGIQQVSDESNYVYVRDKFSAQTYLDLNLPLPKMIFSTAMYYHLTDPLEFTKNVRQIMTDETVWCIQMTYLGSMLESNIYDNIVHEHVAHYSLQSIEYLMNSLDLVIVDSEVVSPYGGSIRLKIMKKIEGETQDISTNLRKLRECESVSGVNSIQALEKFNDRIMLLKNMTKDIVSHLVEKHGKMIALGASTKGNMLCQFLELNNEYIECALDNNEKKIGLIMTGSEIPVVNEKDYFNNLPDYLFVLPYYYVQFFQKLIRVQLGVGEHISLLVPLPHPHFIEVKH